jgi:hypothetical protein
MPRLHHEAFLKRRWKIEKGRWHGSVLPSSDFNSLSSSEKLVEPEVVATSPYPGKSRMPVCCGFDSIKE